MQIIKRKDRAYSLHTLHIDGICLEAKDSQSESLRSCAISLCFAVLACDKPSNCITSRKKKFYMCLVFFNPMKI